MADDDRSLAQPFRPRRPDEVLTEHLQHGRAHHPADQRGGAETEGEGRHRQVLQRVPERAPPAAGDAQLQRRGQGFAPPKSGQDVEPNREEEDREDPHPEHGNRVTELREQHRAVVPDRVLANRGQHTERHPNRGGNHQREDRQLDRRRHRVKNDVGHRPRLENRRPEIALDNMKQVMAKLDRQRLVQPENPLNPRDVLRRRVLPEQHRRRVTGNQVQQEKNEHRDSEQHRNEQEQSIGDVAEQCVSGGVSDLSCARDVVFCVRRSRSSSPGVQTPVSPR